MKMFTVTLSSQYRVVIPKEMRKCLNIKPGQKLLVRQFGDGIVMILIQSVKKSRGFLKGINVDIKREEESVMSVKNKF